MSKFRNATERVEFDKDEGKSQLKYDHMLEVTDLKARIAELEARLESCESALTSMVYQFFCPLESGALAHSSMSAEEESADYLVEFGLAQWADERKHAIVFLGG
jgi:hypothetical protein